MIVVNTENVCFNVYTLVIYVFWAAIYKLSITNVINSAGWIGTTD